MKYKTYITRFKNRFLKKKILVRDPQLMHPDREWAIGLFVAVLIFSLCGLWSIHVYLKNRAASALPVEESAGQTVYRESVVKEALEMVNRRKKNLERLTSESVAPVTVVEEVASTTPLETETVKPIEAPLEDTTTPTLGD